jgi:hypothetical protein
MSYKSPNALTEAGLLPESRPAFSNLGASYRAMLVRFSIPILEEGGRLGLKYLLLSYFRVGDYLPGTAERPLPERPMSKLDIYQQLPPGT